MGIEIKRLLFLPSFSLIISIVSIYASADAESFTGTMPLAQGPYAAGFSTYELFDGNRTVSDKYDYFGTPTEGKRIRPIQICIWYPAKVNADAQRRVIGEYNFPYPHDAEFIDYLSEIQDREIGRLQTILRGNQGLMLDLLNYEVNAYSDIPHAEGEFKLIIYGPDMRKGILENSGLFEYLAGNGFVVAAIHSLGSFELNPSENAADLETLIRDMEFALAYMKEQPYVNTEKIGLLGYRTGAAAALLLQMRNSDIDAVACVRGTFDNDNISTIMESNPYFDIGRINVPLLNLIQRSDSPADNSLIKRIRFAPRYSVEFSPDYDFLLTNYELIASLIEDSTGQLSRQNIKSCKISCLYILNFFKAYLSDDSTAREFLDASPTENNISAGILTTSFFPGEEAPPTESQFMSIINERGVETAVQIYKKFRPPNPDHVFFREFDINVLGYRFLQTGHGAEAILLFELNADAFPTSANAWDSYGEACMAVGDYSKALENYKKALEVLPQDTNINEQLRNLIGENAPQQITRLEELIRESSE